ncbi:hypothetical protein Q0P64_13685, partial [Staphylococcus aureus]|nr:hypothetical protein [Staphylococcus aureus]
MYPVSRIAHFLTRPVKIVLWPQMEDSSQYLLSPLQGLAEHNHRRHPLDGRLLEEMEFLASVTQRHLTIFGMDRSLWKVTV